MVKLDGRSDLYSLGCTMYHLISGQAPLQGRVVDGLHRRADHGERDPDRAGQAGAAAATGPDDRETHGRQPRRPVSDGWRGGRGAAGPAPAEERGLGPDRHRPSRRPRHAPRQVLPRSPHRSRRNDAQAEDRRRSARAEVQIPRRKPVPPKPARGRERAVPRRALVAAASAVAAISLDRRCVALFRPSTRRARRVTLGRTKVRSAKARSRDERPAARRQAEPGHEGRPRHPAGEGRASDGRAW